MEIKDLRETLVKLDEGWENSFKYPTHLPPKDVDKILDELGATEQVGEDWNGCDLDWSMDLNIDGVVVQAWGSAYEGTLLFRKE